MHIFRIKSHNISEKVENFEIFCHIFENRHFCKIWGFDQKNIKKHKKRGEKRGESGEKEKKWVKKKKNCNLEQKQKKGRKPKKRGEKRGESAGDVKKWVKWKKTMI